MTVAVNGFLSAPPTAMDYYKVLLASCVLILALILPLVLTQQADPDMSTRNTYRCGIFLIPGGSSGQNTNPEKVFSLPTQFKATCSMPKPSLYNQTCYEIMRHSFSMWNYSQPSKAHPKSGKTIGDDFCTLIGQDEYMGREVGFFFNYCGQPDWIDTSLRRKTRVCCRSGKYVSCPS